jgi:phosphoribosylformylglycinamidine synthase
LYEGGKKREVFNMKFQATVYVSLKQGYSDPEGETTTLALQGLGYAVTDVRSSKAYEMYLEAESKSEAETAIDEMCRRLLTNPIKDDYRFELREAR